MGVLWWMIVGGVALLIPTAYAAKIGAPYAPTRRAAIKNVFDKIGLGKTDFLVDLGAGDGTVLVEAVKRQARAVGYELSPIMWVIIWLRLRIAKQGKIKYANFYKQTLPEATTVVFAFLMPDNMSRVKEFLARQALPQAKYFIAYAFPLSADTPPLHVVHTKNCARMFVYNLNDLVQL